MVEYIVAAAAFLIASRIIKKNESKIKGHLGEGRLTRCVRNLPIPGKVIVMRDSLFPSDWGSSQIDVLAITRFGIMVFEMKNRSGDIHGAVGKGDWFVTVNNHTYSLPSPVKQNNTHIAALHSILSDQFPHATYIPLTVFSDQARLFVQNSRNKVCHLRDVHKVISRQLGPEVFTDKEVEEIAGILGKNLLKSRQARKNHLTAIKLSEEIRGKYTRAEQAMIRQQIMNMAKDKPILSASGEVTSTTNPISKSAMNRPLHELLKDAESRAPVNEQERAPNQGR